MIADVLQNMKLVGIRQVDSRIHGWGYTLFPRDRIFCATSVDGKRWVRDGRIHIDVLDVHGADMVYYPCCVQVSEKEFRLYFYGSRRTSQGWTGAIYLAHSTDGVHWKCQARPILEPGGQWDPMAATSPCVFRAEPNRWEMFYVGLDSQKRGTILSAVSPDGKQWTKQKTVIGKDHIPNGYQILNCHYYRQGDWHHLIFTIGSLGDRRFFGAQSKDLHSWEIREDVVKGPLTRGMKTLSAPNLIKTDSGWRLYFHMGQQLDIDTSIAWADSEDGITFEAKGICLGPDPQSGYEQDGVGFPSVIHDGSHYRMYYTGFWGRHLIRPWHLRVRKKQ